MTKLEQDMLALRFGGRHGEQGYFCVGSCFWIFPGCETDEQAVIFGPLCDRTWESFSGSSKNKPFWRLLHRYEDGKVV
jgi:hypothetical protein